MQNRVASSIEWVHSCAFKAAEEMPIDDFRGFFSSEPALDFRDRRYTNRVSPMSGPTGSPQAD
jgi:hypothetical protein